MDRVNSKKNENSSENRLKSVYGQATREGHIMVGLGENPLSVQIVFLRRLLKSRPTLFLLITLLATLRNHLRLWCGSVWVFSVDFVFLALSLELRSECSVRQKRACTFSPHKARSEEALTIHYNNRPACYWRKQKADLFCKVELN